MPEESWGGSESQAGRLETRVMLTSNAIHVNRWLIQVECELFLCSPAYIIRSDSLSQGFTGVESVENGWGTSSVAVSLCLCSVVSSGAFLALRNSHGYQT